MEFKEKFESMIEKINQTLSQLVLEKDTPEGTLYKVMRYSLLAGGKRLRPVLALAVCEMLDGNLEQVLPYACAIEMIHTYSLIHDDLPAMDNDDYRRGRLTNHKVYGEAMAILAGDALLNFAFETMLQATLKDSRNMALKVKAMNIIAQSAGSSGMIGGQVVDLESEGKKIPLEQLEYMHRSKTGALIKAPVMAAAAVCNADEKCFAYLEDYAEKVGLAFQIKDDILDVEGSLEVMGKPAGSDVANEKSTFVTLHGLEESKKIVNIITNEAIDSLRIFGEKSWFLKDLACYLVGRQN